MHGTGAKTPSKAITKWKLFAAAIKGYIWVSFCIALIACIITLLTEYRHAYNANGIFMSAEKGILIFVFLALALSIQPFAAIMRINRQERVMHFSFSEEMEKAGISSTEYESEDWFISTGCGEIIALHRAYIKELVSIRDVRRGRYVIAITNPDGNTVRLSARKQAVVRFRNWFRNG